MKKNQILVWSALAAAVSLASCNVNDEIENNDPVAVRFTAGIDKAATVDGTRAAGVTWGSDAIGIFMVNNGTTTIAEDAVNKRYTTTGSGAFTAAAGNEIYYPMNGSAVDFIAYYPYKSGATLTTPIDVQIATTQTAANQPDFDLLYSANSTGYSKTSTGGVALTFEHKLAKFVMNIVQPSTLSPNNTGLINADLPGMTITIKGMNTKNAFNLSTGNLGAPNTTANITPRTVTNGSMYEAIILPGSYAAGALTVEFKLSSNEVFTWNVSAETFEGGNEYAYDVTLSRTGVTVTGTIIPWVTLNRGDVTAE